jgi:hypothetical protein
VREAFRPALCAFFRAASRNRDNLFWHAKFHKEPENQWLRGVVFDTFSD